MSTKAIARITGLAVSLVNSAARDLGIARYDSRCRCWRVADSAAGAFIEHLSTL